MPLLRAKNISKIYEIDNEYINALKNINLEIHKGEFVSIVGKSGSGKSTLMHILGLLDSPSSGELFLNDMLVTNLTEKQQARVRNKEIGFIFQFFNLLPRTSTLDNVILPLQYSDVPRSEWKARAIKHIEEVGLGDRINNKSNELSGGQKQRVAIARALVTEPSIIFADEPTGNLDSKTGREIEKLFHKLHDEGKTIVIVTHDEDLAKISDRQIVISDGKIQK